jgi:secondary thiamine-phosphate synthase enzyme
VTKQIGAWVAQQGLQTGLLTVFCRHTSCSLLIQENAAPAARHDLEAFFARIAPQDPSAYTHNDEGPDDMPAHIRSALTQVQLTIPLLHGRLALGTWQGIYLFEHRRQPHRRRLALHLLGE